jgi:hypothetical protein
MSLNPTQRAPMRVRSAGKSIVHCTARRVPYDDVGEGPMSRVCTNRGPEASLLEIGPNRPIFGTGRERRSPPQLSRVHARMAQAVARSVTSASALTVQS